ncbi:MAG: EscU/YscU/HrcU family type III secretion system export apparatus switch protein [Syntrophales bacterium]|nr:EscU/YscU/HrcU family type III secretion system export apparatus switch protein [Syntrophales bacterium]
MPRKRSDAQIPMAAAISYEAGKDNAPRLAARGRGFVAERIIELARKHNIPIKQDPSLVEILSRLDIDSEIPPELYRAVAEILAFIYRMNEKHRSVQ